MPGREIHSEMGIILPSVLDPRSQWIEGVFAAHSPSRGIPPRVRDQSLRVMRQYLEVAGDQTLVEERIVGKVSHSRDVVQATTDIVSRTPELPWNIPQALSIGLAHDVGRFPQAHVGALLDVQTNFDHGAVGADMVRRFDWADLDIDSGVVVTAIGRHNQPFAETVDPYALLIRDADKLALFRDVVQTNSFVQSHGDAPPTTVSPAVKQSFLEGTPVLNKDLQTAADEVMRVLAWPTDITYEATHNILREEDLLRGVQRQLYILTGGIDPDIAARVDELTKASSVRISGGIIIDFYHTLADHESDADSLNFGS